MNTSTSRRPGAAARRMAMVLVGLALAGCAATAVTSDTLEQNTAFALGLEPGSFQISDRQDQGIKTTYRVVTQAGRRYSCYVTGAVGITGRAVSDALCSEIGRPPGAGAATGGPACNALLKAAGRC